MRKNVMGKLCLKTKGYQKVNKDFVVQNNTHEKNNPFDLYPFLNDNAIIFLLPKGPWLLQF